MVVDTSALLAIYLDEADSHRFEIAILAAPAAIISAGTLLEATIVVEARHGRPGATEFDRLVRKLGIATVPVDAEQVEAGRLGFRRFGKGRHAANLNYGDCFAYALAVTTGEPLLFKGEDFAETDVVRAIGGPGGQHRI
jgi:ribonuclease VapC